MQTLENRADGAGAEGTPTLPNFNFFPDEPPKWHCELCGQPFKAWMVGDKEWALIPEQFRRLALCEADYRRLVREAGHDPDTITFNYNPWKTICEWWENDRKAPAHHCHIHFDFGVITENLCCEVIGWPEDLQFHVRLLNTSVCIKEIKAGMLYLASWDSKTFHPFDRRPLLKPVHRLRSLPKQQNRRTPKQSNR